jgi:RNA polymerase sigma factor (sigma-70 family)
MTTAPLATIPDDPTLLHAFLHDHSHDAFAQLVHRHLPAVHAQARRILRDPHRADDIAQAVFLLLAQRAATLKSDAPLAGWLYRVTTYTCANAKKMDARRKHHEQEAARMSHPCPNPTTSDLELHLDRFLTQLPTHERDALLLRYARSHTPTEIAILTRTSESATKKRLQRALAHLRAKFLAAGIPLPAAFTPATLLAAAPLPAHFTTAAITTALSPATAAPSILSLAHGASHMLLVAKVKTIAAILIACTLLGGTAGLLLANHAHPSPPPIPVPAPPIFVAARAPAFEPAPQPPADEVPDPITVHGLVLDPAGKPFPGATVFVQSPDNWTDRYITHTIAAATTGPDGRYQLTFHKADVSAFSDGFGVSLADAWKTTQLRASAPGFGLAWSKWSSTTPEGNLTLQLTADDTPIRGQLLTPDGTPAPRVPILVDMLINGGQQQLDEAYTRDPDAGAALLVDLPLGNAPIATDAEGRFEIHGLGRDRLAYLQFHSPDVAYARIEVMTRTMQPKTRTVPQPSGIAPIFTTFGATFTFTSRPVMSIQGTIRDGATHQPMQGVLVESRDFAGPFQGIDPHGLIKAVTDQTGHYRLDGLPRGKGTSLNVLPNPDQPYFMRELYVNDPGTESVATADVELHQGIWITGKVTDKITGQPLSARLAYTTYVDNAHTDTLPEFQRHRGMGYHEDDQFLRTTAPDGTYKFVAAPGKAIVAVQNWSGRYLRGVGVDAIPALQPNQFLLYQPAPPPNLLNAVTEIDIPETTPAATVDFQLDPGHTARVNIIDPDGKPLPGCLVTGDHAETYMGWNMQKIALSHFDAIAIGPDESRTIMVFNDARKLGKVDQFTSSDLKDGTFTIQLEPLAEITGRCIDRTTGQPIPNLELEADVEGKGLATVTTDANGSFRYPIITGGPCSLSVRSGPYVFNNLATELMLDPGETQDLGDIRLKKMKPPK